MKPQPHSAHCRFTAPLLTAHCCPLPTAHCCPLSPTAHCPLALTAHCCYCSLHTAHSSLLTAHCSLTHCASFIYRRPKFHSFVPGSRFSQKGENFPPLPPCTTTGGTTLNPNRRDGFGGFRALLSVSLRLTFLLRGNRRLRDFFFLGVRLVRQQQASSRGRRYFALLAHLALMLPPLLTHRYLCLRTLHT
jgi:hypothetical protein